MQKNNSGRFITFEGGEGVGKSTQVRLLHDAFEKSGIDCVLTREPGGTKGAEAIRELLVNGDVDKWNANTELLLHFAARSDHVEKLIKPALQQGKFVICDRFTDSTMAYQAYGHGVKAENITKLKEIILEGFEPDITFVLDIDPEDGIKRAQNRGEHENRYEKMGSLFHQRVRKGFLEITSQNPARCVNINAGSEILKIHKEIVLNVNRKFNISLSCSQ